jgi:ferredoxin-NADP reductase
VIQRAVRLVDVAATPHGVDRYLELVDPTWSTTEVRGRVVAVRRRTAGSVTLTIEANRNWTGFQAGQYTEVTVEIDGVRHTRCYSMASSARPGGRRFELTVKAHPGGRVSNFLVDQAQVGLVVGLSRAQGEFTLPDAGPGRLLLVSGGSGITPVLSMVRTLCDGGHVGPVTFVHYDRRRGDMTYEPELAALAAAHANLRVVRVFTEEPGAGDLDGLVDVAQLAAIDPGWAEATAYVCGPAPLMAALSDIYRKHDLSTQLHTEAFALAQVLAEAGSVGGVVRFTTTATAIASDGRPLLQQAEAAGVRPASGCRMGICHTCACPLRAGTVRDVVTGALTSHAGADIRICVSVPVGDVDIDL